MLAGSFGSLEITSIYSLTQNQQNLWTVLCNKENAGLNAYNLHTAIDKCVDI